MAKLKDNKKPPGRQAPGDQQEKVIAIISQEFEVDTSRDEMVLAAGKHHLTNAVESAEVARFCNSTIVCNPGGSGLMQHLQDLSAKVSDLDTKFSNQEAKLSGQIANQEAEHSAQIANLDAKLSGQIANQDAKHSARIANQEAEHSGQIANQDAKHSAQIADLDAKLSARIANLEAQVSSLLPFKNYFLDVRERAFLTYLRNYWREYGASRQKRRPSPNTAASKIHTRISLLNQFILHGGNAEVDALMFHERHPVQELAPFQCLYGLGPDQIKELASKGHRSIINLLNTAGAIHYESHHMAIAQQEGFDEVIELVHNGNFEDAEEAATKFLSAVDFVELARVTPINEQED